jgi:hypothetical protein
MPVQIWPYALIAIIAAIAVMVLWQMYRRSPAYFSTWNLSSVPAGWGTNPWTKHAKDVTAPPIQTRQRPRNRDLESRLSPAKRHNMKCHGAPCGRMLHRGSRYAK